MKQNSLKRRFLIVAFWLAVFAYDSARGQLPSGVVARFYYDEQGRVIRQEKDTNGNGEMDTFSYFENGQLVRKEVDRKHNGRIDLWATTRELS